MPHAVLLGAHDHRLRIQLGRLNFRVGSAVAEGPQLVARRFRDPLNRQFCEQGPGVIVLGREYSRPAYDGMWEHEPGSYTDGR